MENNTALSPTLHSSPKCFSRQKACTDKNKQKLQKNMSLHFQVIYELRRVITFVLVRIMFEIKDYARNSNNSKSLISFFSVWYKA